jgi:hypothetical protein
MPRSHTRKLTKLTGGAKDGHRSFFADAANLECLQPVDLRFTLHLFMAQAAEREAVVLLNLESAQR